jgi:hypothetical protein
MNPAGRLHCSLEDYGKFLREHLRAGKSALLNTGSYDVMHAPGAGDYQAGWFVVPRPWANGNALTHTGSNTLNYAVTWAAPDNDIAVVAVANSAGILQGDLAGQLDQIVGGLIGTYAP